jgi:phage gp16-like protein
LKRNKSTSPCAPSKGGHKTTEVRRGLLATVHIAAKELGIEDVDRRDIMLNLFGVESSKALSDGDLRRLLDYFGTKGWKARGRRSEVRDQALKDKNQAEAFRHRARALIEKAENEGLVTSARGLIKKVCGVDNLDWCRDAGRLKRLLAVLESICHGPTRTHTDKHE